jgi:hypothetical protein
VSDNRSSDNIQIPGALAVFAILVLVIGLLLLATSNIGPESSVRAAFSPTPGPTSSPAPTANAFAFKGYRPFASPDGVVKIEFPESWTFIPSPRGEKSYIFTPDQTGSSGVVVQLRVVARADLVNGMQGVTPQSTPKEVLTAAFTQSGSATQKIEDAKSGNLNGARTLQMNAPDQSGQPSGQDLETILLALDNTNFLLVQAIAPTTARERTKPIVDKMLETLQIDAALAAATSPAVTPAPAVPTPQK